MPDKSCEASQQEVAFLTARLFGEIRQNKTKESCKACKTLLDESLRAQESLITSPVPLWKQLCWLNVTMHVFYRTVKVWMTGRLH